MKIESHRHAFGSPLKNLPPGPDSYEPRETFTPTPPAAHPNRYKAALKALTMGATVAATFSAVPVYAQTQVKPQDDKAKAALDKEADAALASLNQKGMSELGPRCTDTDPVCQARLASLPESAQKEYREMPLVVKRMMNDKINAKTTVIPLVLTINHRKAFVKGEALGHNVFDFIEKKTTAMAEQGKIRPEHAPRVKRFLDMSRQLTPPQREAFVDLITRDVALAKK